MDPSDLKARVEARTREVEAQLDRARSGLARTEALIAERGPPPVAGDILFAPNAGEPELLVLAPGPEDRSWWAVTLDEVHDAITIDDDVAGALSVDPASRRVMSNDALASLRRSGVLEAAPLAALNAQLGVVVARIAPRPKWPFALAAAVLLAGLAALMLEASPRRDHPGLYALRSAADGEVGAELRIGDRVCRARGVLGAGPCAVAPGESVTVQYRLDDRIEHRFAVVLSRPTASDTLRVVHPAAALEPTATAGEERCARGMCDWATIDAAPQEVWVVFAREPVDAPPPGAPTDWPGAVPYRFTLEARE